LVWRQILADLPDLPEQIRAGKFEALLAWLREKIHVHGTKYEPQELVERVTGSKITPGPYVRYLQEKFSDIYGL
jgi:carboxypeptidase Taq